MHFLAGKSVGVDKKTKESPKKKKKKEDRVVEKVDGLAAKLKNITITVQNDQPRKVKDKTPPKKAKDKDTKNLLEQLKMLQTGKVTSDSIVSSHTPPAKKQKNKSNEVTAEESLEAIINSAGRSPMSDLKTPKSVQTFPEFNKSEKRAEIEALNKIIQEKIERTRTQLNRVVNRQHLQGTSSSSSSSPPKLPKLMIPVTTTQENDFTTSKAQVGENEIYRYTNDQIHHLQQYSTWQEVPRLLQLNLCGTQFSPLDDFVMRLVKSPTEERNEIILSKAQERNFIARQGCSEFRFLSPNFVSSEGVSTQASQSSVASQASSSTSKNFEQKTPVVLDYIERYRLMAKSDDELNNLIYQHEFGILFEGALKNQELRDTSQADVIKNLVETNQAYIIEGEIRVNQRNYQEAYVSHPKGRRDVCVSKLILRKHAFHGDIVRVLVKNEIATPNQQSQPSPDIVDVDLLIEEIPLENKHFGCVLDILEQRHSRRVLGTFASFLNIRKNRRHLMVIARDPKVPNIRVSARTGIPTDTQLSDQHLIAVEIIGWNYDQPQGKVISIIGKKGQLKTENVAILQQNNLDPQPFEQNILDQLPVDPFVIPEKEFEYREDLRKKCIFSIDPETARDLDDALSCEMLPNGNIEVGVHISDVSYFVKEDSDLDKIVRDKATTIYLVDTVYHMLPEKLCLMCSLLPGVDKLVSRIIYH
jgi:hypothetical protein